MKALEKQGWHAAILLALLLPVVFIARFDDFRQGALLSRSTSFWLGLAMAIAVLHQLWVLVFWRLELHYGTIRNLFGAAGFPLYAFGFIFLFLSRPLSLIALALANSETLLIAAEIRWFLVGGIMLPVLYVLYSVIRFFGVRRALGADHFDASYRELELVRRGSFSLLPNSMYTLGLLFLWIPGLIWASKAALLAAAFQHGYIWVHYYTVESPDMRNIYGAH